MVHELHSHPPTLQPSPHINVQSATLLHQTHTKLHSFLTTQQKVPSKMLLEKSVRSPTNFRKLAVILKSFKDLKYNLCNLVSNLTGEVEELTNLHYSGRKTQVKRKQRLRIKKLPIIILIYSKTPF